jgi:hypothetical protein
MSISSTPSRPQPKPGDTFTYLGVACHVVRYRATNPWPYRVAHLEADYLTPSGEIKRLCWEGDSTIRQVLIASVMPAHPFK